MKVTMHSLFIIVSTTLALVQSYSQWAEPVAPIIPEADGYVAIPHAAVMPQKSSTFRAIFNATGMADNPTQLVPAINMVGSELNLLGAIGVPLRNAKFVVVFHGPAMDGILDDAHYKEKFGVSNQNLNVITALKRSGVNLFVCGQNLAAENMDPLSITPDVTIASDALIVLMEYQNKGYATLSF